MPIDARISMGLRPQTYDAFAAYDTGRQNEQTFRTNQMAQQAAQATAARNAMIQQRAAQTDFGDPTSVRNFAAMGPGTEDYLSSVTAGDSMFTARDTNRRAESDARIKQNEAGMVELRTVVGRVFNNPDDASLANAAQRYPQFAADINRIAANPDANARRTGLATLVASLPGGSEFLDAVTQEYTTVDTGGTTRRVPNRTYLPGEVQSFTKTPDPTKYTDIPTAAGIRRVYADGRSELLRDETGAPLTAAPTPAQQQADAEAAAEQTSQANARQDVNSTLESMMAEYDNLYRLGAIVSTDRTGAQNVGAAAGASLPGRVVGRAVGSEAQTARDNIAAAMPQIMLGLQTASGLSSTQLNSNAELQFFKRILGDPDASYQTVVDAIGRFQRFADSLLGGGGGGAAPPAPRAPPQAGEVRAGYRFRGGDPGNQSNWTPVR